MGAYLSEPVTEKEIDFGENVKLLYAVAAMQGWRTEMEDAHLCALDIGKETSLFGVFDGHGGKEVAKFVALHMVEELRKSEGFRRANIPAGLKETYLSLDDLIRDEKSQPELLRLCAKTKPEQSPLEQIIQVDNVPQVLKQCVTIVRSDSPGSDSDDSQFDADSVNEEREVTVGSFPVVLSDASSQGEAGSEDIDAPKPLPETPRPGQLDDREAVVPVANLDVESVSNETKGELHEPLLVSVVAYDGKERAGRVSSEQSSRGIVEDTASGSMDVPAQRVDAASSEDFEILSSSCIYDPELSNIFTQDVEPPKKRFGFLMKLLSFVCPFSCLNSSKIIPDEGDLKSPLASSRELSSESSPYAHQSQTHGLAEVLCEESLDSIPQELIREDETDENQVTEAGCTAVVALIKEEKLYVANAGDSRCVLCQNGVAIPMSKDHKPNDPDEYSRIRNAGGFVSDGRVNGCLNLSRALGDMEYKTTPGLPPEEFMVTANPDVTETELHSGDEFVILACDGIWDVLTDQEACNFVRSRLEKGQSLNSITAEMCDYCLSNDANGTGNGCDNMTAMVILFKDNAVFSST